MKHILTIASLLISLSSHSQSWIFRNSSSDFDGNVKSTRCTGYGGTSPYSSPTLAVNYFESSGSLNFYLKGAGYTGCDGNRVTMVFDGERKYYTYSVSENENNDALFFEVFTKAGESTILPMEIIFDQMMNSKRLSIRYESDCFKRDYYFNLDGFRESIKKVLSHQDIEKSISLKSKMMSFNDSIASLVNSTGTGFIVEFDNSEIDKYPIFFNQVGEPYEISLDDLKKLVRIFNSFRLGFEHQEEYRFEPYPSYNEVFRVVFELNDQNEICARTTRDFSPDIFHTGYFVEISHNKLMLKLSPSQKQIEEVINTYTGEYSYSVNRLMRGLINDDFYMNTIEQYTLDALAQKIRDREIYQLRIVKDRNGLAKFEERDFNGSFYDVYGISFPYNFKKTPEELEQERIQKAREIFVRDSTEKWFDTPDPTKPPLQFHQVSTHPTTKDCPIGGMNAANACLESHVINYLLASIQDDDLKKLKKFALILKIDGYGNLKIESCRGLNPKKEAIIYEAFKGIPPVLPGRNGWGANKKVVDVILSMNIDLNQI